MKAFSKLFEELDSTTSTNEKIAALRQYFANENPENSMWAILVLTGKLSKRVLTSHRLKDLFLTATNYPEWLYDASYEQVGDTAETLSLLAHSLNLCPEESTANEKSLTDWMEQEIPSLAQIKDPALQSQKLLEYWKELSQAQVFILNKLITGALRVGVSERLVIRALTEVYNIPSDLIAHRLTGNLQSGADAFKALIDPNATEVSFSQPYPFCLAHPWNERSEKDFNPDEWCCEWKFDGIRAQIIKRENQVWIWSRGEEQITETFPDLAELAMRLPDGVVLDGEILIYKHGKIQPFQSLQKRLGRKKVSKIMLTEMPVGFFAYDCLEHEGKDLRQLPLRERKEHLKRSLSKNHSEQIQFSPTFSVKDLDDLHAKRSEARDLNAEGLMIKRWDGHYSVGRKTGNWWKFKVDPLTLDAVLIYAQAGSGRRSNLYTDYTFALWNEKHELVPFAKAYSGLEQTEIDELDAWIRRHTKEKFGPVRSVEPFHVFEIGFEGIGSSSRHKSGIAVRFPRILRWRKDKKVDDADTLSNAEALLETYARSS